MISRQHSLFFFATTLLTIFTSQSSLAFTIIPPTQGGGRYFRYKTSYNKGYTQLDAWSFPDPRRFLGGQVLEVKQGGTDGLMNLLNQQFPDWTFLQTGNLEGSFDIQQYYACSPRFPSFGCGGVEDFRGVVGAAFGLNYIPKEGSSDPVGDNVHWIQRILSSYKPGSPDGNYDIIDNLDNTVDPYYDSISPAAGPDFFGDIPFDSNVNKEHYVYAETYLVEEIAPKTVKIYNGVRWGWENKITSPGYYTDSIGGGIGSTPTGYLQNDDGSFGSFPLGFSLNYFGQTYNSFYINNNGNISFGNGVNAYTPNSLTTESLAPMIAPYWADVDTRGTGTVAVRTDIPNQVIVTWDNVGYYSQHTDKTASFQLVLRSPDYSIPPDEGNIGFFYKNVDWETGDASGGINGFGGTQAAVGFSDGFSTVNPGEFLLLGSQQAGISQSVNNNSYWFNLSCSGSGSGGGGGGGCSVNSVDSIATGNSSSLATNAVNQALLFFGIDSSYTSEKSKSVPESTSALGLLILSVWGIIKALKIRQEK